MNDEQEFQMYRQPWVIFKVAESLYGLPISAVQEMVPTGRISSLPAKGGHLRGLMVLRQHTIPVLDLKGLLSEHPHNGNGHGRGAPVEHANGKNGAAETVIVLKWQGKHLGITTDAVVSVEPLPKRTSGVMESAPGFSGADTPVNAIARREQGDELVLLLDFKRLMGVQESAVSDDAARARRFD